MLCAKKIFFTSKIAYIIDRITKVSTKTFDMPFSRCWPSKKTHMTSIKANFHSSLSSAKREDTLSKVERLQKTIEVLSKQLRSLYERLKNAGSIGERQALQQEIRGVESMIEAIQRQIMMITELEKQKQATRLEAAKANSLAPTLKAREPKAGLPDERYQSSDKPHKNE